MKKISKKIFISLFAVIFSFAFVFAFLAVNFSDNKTVVNADILPEDEPITPVIDPNTSGDFILPNLFLPLSSVSFGQTAANGHYYGVVDFQFKMFSNYIVFYNSSCYTGSANAYLRDGNFVSPLVFNSTVFNGSSKTALTSVNVSTLGGNSYVGYESVFTPDSVYDYYFTINSSLAYDVPFYIHFVDGSGFDVNYFNCNIYSITYNLITDVNKFPTFFTSHYTDNTVYYIFTIDLQCFNGSHMIVYLPVVKFVIDWRMNNFPYTVYTTGVISQDLNYNYGYNNGYYAGVEVGRDNGYSSGYTAGYNAGDSSGYDRGKLDGILESNDYSFIGLIGATIDAPIQALTGLLNFNILGVNLSLFVYGLFSITLVIIVIKWMKGGK